MNELMNQKIFALFLLFSIAQVINSFGESFVRTKCLSGRRLVGCNQTLVKAYGNTDLSKSDQNSGEGDTYMMLFTRRNKEHPEYLDACGGSLPKNTRFNSTWDVEVFVHGFLDSVCMAPWMLEMKDQLLYRGDYNVLLIDWSWGNQMDYYSSVLNTRVVGKEIAFMIKNIMEQTGIKTDKIHLVGHSLGAHTVGIAGYYVQKLVRTPLRRITGLDPAGPAYYDAPEEYTLDKSDASFVDVIHSNMGVCLPFNYGHVGPLGHVDFYPNGGSEQLSCIPYILIYLLRGDFDYALGCFLVLPACFHQQSLTYYKVSINSCDCQFIGVKCNSFEDFQLGKCKSCGSDGSNCAVMGMDAEYYPWKEGNNSYYLKTSMPCPHCDNEGINIAGFPLLPPGKEKPGCFSPEPSRLSNKRGRPRSS